MILKRLLCFGNSSFTTTTTTTTTITITINNNKEVSIQKSIESSRVDYRIKPSNKCCLIATLPLIAYFRSSRSAHSHRSLEAAELNDLISLFRFFASVHLAQICFERLTSIHLLVLACRPLRPAAVNSLLLLLHRLLILNSCSALDSFLK